MIDDMSYFNRILGDLIQEGQKSGMLLVTGARQVGKTTLLRKLFPELAYYNLDAVENRSWLLSLPAAGWHKQPGPAIIDEIQKQPELLEKIKFAHDAGSPGRTVMTGSSQILLLKHVRESLAGRVRLLELFPLSVSELAGNSSTHGLLPRLLASPAVLDALPPIASPADAAALQEAENRIYAWGGMPALIPLDPGQKREWLADYRATFLQRDLLDLARLNDLLPFATFQKLVALRAGSIVNYADLARDCGVAPDTARRFLEYLTVSYQTELLQPWFSNQGRRLVKSPKIILFDMGILRSLTMAWEMDTGELFENFVIAECLKTIRTLKLPVRYYFLRTRAGAEVDLLLETEQGCLGMEIKNTQYVTDGDARHLRSLATELGERWLGGLVVYRGDTLRSLAGPNIKAIPSWRLWGEE